MNYSYMQLLNQQHLFYQHQKLYNIPNLRYHGNESMEPSAMNLHKNNIFKANYLPSAKVYINDSYKV